MIEDSPLETERQFGTNTRRHREDTYTSCCLCALCGKSIEFLELATKTILLLIIQFEFSKKKVIEFTARYHHQHSSPFVVFLIARGMN